MKLSTLRATLPKIINGSLRDLGAIISALGEKAYIASSAPTSLSTAGVLTYTAAQCLTGTIIRDPNGAGRSDVLPTAALLVAAMTDPEIGDVVRFSLVNGADAAETITVGAGTGGAFDANQTAASRVVSQNTTRVVHMRITGVAAGSEAYVVWM